MAKDRLIRGMNLVRRDLGSLLFHWTRSQFRRESESIIDSSWVKEPAGNILFKILREGFLKGSSGFIRGNHQCVCFTEAPISEVAALFKLASYMRENDRPRYEPYGIAVRKEWLFSQGGRPVIYQSDAEYENLSEELKWRHARYEPNNGIDFTWEREWRIRTSSLTLDPKHTLVVVPTVDEAFCIMYENSVLEAIDWDESSPSGVYHKPRWLSVSLDFFGVGNAL